MKIKKVRIGKRVIEAEVCDNYLSQLKGLMFRRDKRPLLFVFKNKGLRAIHSFFCMRFLAIWFADNEIIDAKFVEPWSYNIVPKREFDKLLEVPFDSENELSGLSSVIRKI